MDTGQLLAMLAGAGTVISALATTIYKLQGSRITALETENVTLRAEARAAVMAKEAEITTLREIAANIAMERSKEAAWRREQGGQP